MKKVEAGENPRDADFYWLGTCDDGDGPTVLIGRHHMIFARTADQLDNKAKCIELVTLANERIHEMKTKKA
jgi:hypothetical protein